MVALEILKGIVYIVVICYGVEIAGKVIDVFNKNIDEVQANTKLAEHQKLNLYIDVAQDAVETAVLSVSQTYVDVLKKNGAFTKEAHYQAKEQAVNIANALITKDVRDAIETLHGDVDTYIDNLIEKCVLEIKKKQQEN